MMRPKSNSNVTLPLKMVGGSDFGRYPMISVEETWNMIISDDFLVDYAGYEIASTVSPNGEGRGIHVSVKSNNIYLAVDNNIYIVDNDFNPLAIGQMTTFQGDVFFSENNSGQIAICDGKNIYIFDYLTNTFTTASIDFIPAYISFQDGYFMSGVQGEAEWRLSNLNDGTTWPDDQFHIGEFESKPNNVIAIVPIPGQNGLVFVFGQTVTEPWYDAGLQLFPYQRYNFLNIDYGCLNAATIATLENITVWLASNEKAGPFIMYSNGGQPQKISTDGIDFKLSSLIKPDDCYGFLFRQDGHLIYQLTFVTDNFSLIYDFNTSKFSNVCDNQMNYHIAKRVVFFNNSYYFISINDGNLYKMSSQITTFNGDEIPRIRICPPLRLPSTLPFLINNLSFPIEQGTSTDILPSVDLSISNNGGYSFGNYSRMNMQTQGNYLNRFIYWNMGWGNQFIPQFRFWGFGRFLCGNGEVNILQ